MAAGVNRRYIVAALFALSFLVYGRCVTYDFLWDDQRSHLGNNEALMHNDLKTIWSKPYDGLYIPVSYTMWDLIRNLPASRIGNELVPAPFHLANILLHSLNTLIVFLILLRLLRNQTAAFAGALIFACHPLQVESVVWISEFRGLLSAAFSLSGLLLLLKYFDAEIPKKNLVAMATLLYVLALLSKPSAASMPFVTGFIVWSFYPRKFRASLFILSGWILLMIPVLLITSNIQPALNGAANIPLFTRFFVFTYSFWFYITKFFMPLKLVACYGLTPAHILEDSWLYVYASIVTGTGIFLWIKRDRFKVLFTVFFSFAAIILPVSGFVSFNYQRYSNVADRYCYVAMLCCGLLAAWAWASSKKIALRILICVFVTCCVLLSVLQVPAWKNEFTMWDHSMKYYPDQFMAAYNRGVQFAKHGQTDEAIKDYTQALKFNDKDAATYTNRANAYAQKNMLPEALQDYKSALALKPADGSIYYNRALTWYNQGDYFQSNNDLQRAISMGFEPDPEFVKVVNNGIRSLRKQ